MFHKKLVGVLCYIVGILLTLKVLLLLTMFVWSYFGPAPIQVWDASIQGVLKYILFAQEVGITLFIYCLISAVYHHVQSAKKKS